MSNKRLGNRFENRLVSILAQNGFWCHLFAQNQAGQPADIIAVKNGKPHLIDCKVCTHDLFPFGRMEENQRLSMTHWMYCGNGDGIFALETSNGEIYMLSFYRLMGVGRGVKALNKTQMEFLGLPLERWLLENG